MSPPRTGYATLACCMLLACASSTFIHGLAETSEQFSVPANDGSNDGISGRRLLTFWSSHSWPSYSWRWAHSAAPTAEEVQIVEEEVQVPIEQEEPAAAPKWNCGKIAYQTLYAGDEDIVTLDDVAGAGECCAACASDATCNIWVYCPEPLGCADPWGKVTPKGSCDLKIQYGYDFQGDTMPATTDEGEGVKFTSGVVYQPDDVIAAPAAGSAAPGGGSAAPGAGPETPLEPGSGGSTAGNGTPSQSSSGGSAAGSPPAASGSGSGKCKAVESGVLYGGGYIATLTGIDSSEECCDKCFRNSQCNIFAYCTGDGNGEGCRNPQGKVIPPGRCLLKFQVFPKELSIPDVEVESGTWTSGVAGGA